MPARQAPRRSRRLADLAATLALRSVRSRVVARHEPAGRGSALLGDTGSALVLYRLLLPYAEFNVENAADAFRGSVSRYLGLLASTSGKSAAARHYEDALMHNAHMGARPWLARTQQDYAQMLHVRNRSGDRERARELAEQAAATFAELGMAG